MGRLPDSMGQSVIVVIPRKDKNPLHPESYRPIWLLSTDVKILAKILASRLNKVIKHIIHSDQVGFMSNMSTAVNIRHAYLNMQVQFWTIQTMPFLSTGHH